MAAMSLVKVILTNNDCSIFVKKKKKMLLQSGIAFSFFKKSLLSFIRYFARGNSSFLTSACVLEQGYVLNEAPLICFTIGVPPIYSKI